MLYILQVQPQLFYRLSFSALFLPFDKSRVMVMVMADSELMYQLTLFAIGFIFVLHAKLSDGSYPSFAIAMFVGQCHSPPRVANQRLMPPNVKQSLQIARE